VRACICDSPYCRVDVKAMVGTGEALLNIRAKGGPAGQADGSGAASVPSSQEFDFQSELQKFDKVSNVCPGWWNCE